MKGPRAADGADSFRISRWPVYRINRREHPKWGNPPEWGLVVSLTSADWNWGGSCEHRNLLLYFQKRRRIWVAERLLASHE